MFPDDQISKLYQLLHLIICNFFCHLPVGEAVTGELSQNLRWWVRKRRRKGGRRRRRRGAYGNLAPSVEDLCTTSQPRVFFASSQLQES